MIMLVYAYMFILVSIFHIWEKTCSLCVSEPGLLRLISCPPIASTYLQTTYHFSLWPTNTNCVYIPNFLDPFISCRDWSYFQSLAIVNRAAMKVHSHLCCVLSCIPWAYAQEQYHWIIWQFYLSVFFFYVIKCLFSLYSYIYMYIHCLGHFSPCPLTPFFSLPPPSLPGRTCVPLSPILLKRRHKQ
jgi:hypothetical protein